MTRGLVLDEAAGAPQTEAVAATRLWCPLCRVPKAYRHKPVPAGSRQHARGFWGEHLICVGCATTIATCYVEDAHG